MPYTRPDLTDLIEQVVEDINTAQITDASSDVLTSLLPMAVLRVVGMAQAGMSYEHYGYLDYIARQAVPWTATDEYLEGWASLKGINRIAATATQGTASFAGTEPGVIPDGTNVIRSDGMQFVTVGDSAIAAGTTTATVKALTPGSAGNFTANAIFRLGVPIAYVQPASSASTQTTPGTDAELDAALRTRMLLAYAAPPQGGDRTDYVEWALAVPGVTRAWVTPVGMGVGTVVVYVMFDIAEAGNGGFPIGSNGVAAAETRATPATGDQLTVANALLPIQPVPALVYVCAPVPQAVNFTVSDLGAANTTANQALIRSALQDMFNRLGQVGGTINPTTGAAWAGIEPDAWYAALEAIPGLVGFKVTAPAGAIAPSTGNLLTLGTVTFNT